jgi:hypothetical protein
MSIPALEIPIRFQVGNVPGQLASVGTAGKKAGDDTAAGFDRASQGVASTTDAVATLMKAQMALGVMKQAAQAIGDEYKRVGDNIKTMAMEFIALRKTMQELSSLKDVRNDEEFVLSEARKGQAVNLTPQEAREFQSQFQNFAGAQIAEQGGKLTPAQAEDYSGRIAQMAKIAGINPASGAEAAGILVETAKGPQNVEALMQQFNVGFTALQKGRVDLARALPQMSRIMAHGINFEEASQLFAIAAPASPGEESTAVEASMKAVDAMKAKGTGKEFGVVQGMTQFQSIKAFAENIERRRTDNIAAGMTEQMAEDNVTALLLEKKVVEDQREARGLVRGFGIQGVRLGGFETYRRLVAGVPKDLESQLKKRYEESPEGIHEKAVIDSQVAKLEQGAEFAPAETELLKARTARTRSRADVALAPGENAARNWLSPASLYGHVDAEQQKINAEALRSVRARALRAGIPGARFGHVDSGEAEGGVRSPGLAGTDVLRTSQVGVNKEITYLLKRIADAAKVTADAAAAPKAAVPLVVKPPPDNGKRPDGG